MRAPVVVVALVTVSCAATSREPSSSPVAVAVPVPPAASPEATFIQRPRSLLAEGEYALAISEVSHHGCSRSWGTSSVETSASITIDRHAMSVAYKAQSHSSHGSHGSPPTSSSLEWSAELSGEILERTADTVRASLTFKACQGACVEGPVEVVCRLEELELDAPHASAAKPGAGGTVPGLRCKGLSSFVPGGREVVELPFARGAGVQLSVQDSYARLLRPQQVAQGG